ncbi:hypothetical protein SOCE26_095730 [Sorangium cellulosum]|uniref:Secreted protein n=1 Tax=Sorangium cellulosum TaxID=56 RepID=A0A2L0F952_SORCE|nr:hypothetical protein [Sorangium cellulosum]AUX48047.1 hypothetical protein SOCE26_095730 [Sorangium cellulosum]
MRHKILMSATWLVLIGSLVVGCQSSPGGGPITPPPADTARGGEEGGAPVLEDAGVRGDVGVSGDMMDAGGAPGMASQPGCGVDSALAKYVGKSQDECARIRFICEPGWTYFSDDCGCGCTKQP